MYRVEPIGPDVTEAIDALPLEVLASFAELRLALEASPWTVGRPYLSTNPGGLRSVTFGGGRGAVIFGVIERERSVSLISLVFI